MGWLVFNGFLVDQLGGLSPTGAGVVVVGERTVRSEPMGFDKFIEEETRDG